LFFNLMSNTASTYDFWFNNKEFDDHDQFGSNYYVITFYSNIIFNLDIPDEGYIVVAGTARGVSFNLLCEKYGKDRCIGFDLFNPSNHPNIIIKDCHKLNEQDDIPIAFAHNDIGSMVHTPDLKIHTQKWLINNIIPNGILLGNNNYNPKKFKFEELMAENNFENHQFTDLPKDWIKDLPYTRVEGYMYSKNENNRV